MAAAAAAGSIPEGIIVDEESLLIKQNFKNFLVTFVSLPSSSSFSSPTSSSLDLPSSQLPSSALLSTPQPTYLLQLLELIRHERSTLLLTYTHLTEWHGGLLAPPLLQRWLQLEPYLAEAVREVFDEPTFAAAWKVLRDANPDDYLSPTIKRLPRYYISLHGLVQHQGIRELHAHRIGRVGQHRRDSDSVERSAAGAVDCLLHLR